MPRIGRVRLARLGKRQRSGAGTIGIYGAAAHTLVQGGRTATAAVLGVVQCNGDTACRTGARNGRTAGGITGVTVVSRIKRRRTRHVARR